MTSFPRATVFTVFRLLVLTACLATPLRAAAQQPASDLPMSLERIRQELEQTPGPRLNLDVPLELPVATFKTRVDQRIWVPTLEEVLRKEFAMTVFERQSAAWRSKCCGIGIGQLMQGIERALHDRKLRQIREQIAWELAQLEAARKK